MQDDADDPETDAERAARRAARASWPGRKFRLGEEPDENLEATTTMDERLAMMWPLSKMAYEMAGIPTDPPPRDQLPGRVIRAWEERCVGTCAPAGGLAAGGEGRTLRAEKEGANRRT